MKIMHDMMVRASGGLLSNADQNIGNRQILEPKAPYNQATIVAQTADLLQPIKLNASSADGMTRSIILTACRQLIPGAGAVGPVTAIIEFGNGSVTTRAEVDVPTGPFQGKTLISATNAITPQDGGVIVTVPTGAVNVYYRYDNNLLAAALDVGGPTVAALLMGVGVSVPNATPIPVGVMASVANFSRHFARAYKTQYCYCGPTSVTFGIAQNPVDKILYPVPAFARSVQVLRVPSSAAINVDLYDGRQAMQSVTVASNTSPSIPIVGQEIVVGIGSGSAAAGDKVTFLALCYEVGI
jgi:hypothetical protein